MSEHENQDELAREQERVQELLPPGRERIQQGQQFDEMQRQQENPDGSRQHGDSGGK